MPARDVRSSARLALRPTTTSARLCISVTGHQRRRGRGGDVSPAGRLPFSWPRHIGRVPLVYSHLQTFEPSARGKRYWEEPSSPLYPFGHGLAYTRFAYSRLRLDREHIRVGESVVVSVDVENGGDREADEVVQLYLHQRHEASARPARELKGFEQVAVARAGTKPSRSRSEQRNSSTGLRRPVAGDWVQDATTIDVFVNCASTANLSTALIVTNQVTGRRLRVHSNADQSADGRAPVRV